MKTVILAGGFGTRLREVIKNIPKPMALIAGKPFLEHQIRLLKEQGLEDIILCVHYMKDNIKSYFGNGKKFGVDITYSDEDSPLGTAGAIKNAEKYINNTFFTLNGDSFSKLDLKKFLEFHKAKRSITTISLKNCGDLCRLKEKVHCDECTHFGKVIVNEDKVVGFEEKKPGIGLINTGAYIFEPIIFDYIDRIKNVSLEKEIFPKLAKEEKLFGYSYEGYFIDIGRPITYAQFKMDALEDMTARPSITVRQALQKMSEKGIEALLVTDENGILLGALNDIIIKNYLVRGKEIDRPVTEAMIKELAVTGIIGEEEDSIHQKLLSGTRHLPILDESGKLIDIKFKIEEIKNDYYPKVRGKSPLRIGFAGGGTDLPQFFEKYGGVVINATIDKYCHASIIKRADSKIIINSDIDDSVIFDLRKIEYNGNYDLVKSVIKIINPDFGFDIYLHNDVPPGRGLGSSASIAVLIAKLLSQLKGVEYSDSRIAEIANRAEREELRIKGGWQDQYAAVTGGFNFMEFSKEKTIIYPLRLKDSTINELAEHLTLCYVGKSHFSGKHQEYLEKAISEEEISLKMNRMKDIALKTKDALLSGNLLKIGELLHESWINKRGLDIKLSDTEINDLYETGRNNGAYGGKLLGAGGGGYLLFYHEPEKRNQLFKALKNKGGEIMNFNFEFKGAETWVSKV